MASWCILVRRRLLAALALAIVAAQAPLPALAHHGGGPCEVDIEDEVRVLWPSSSRPIFYHDALDGTLASKVSRPVPGARFWLWPDVESTVGGQPYPDFHVAFYDHGDKHIATFAPQGRVTAIVPGEASYGLVWMQYGPDLQLPPPGGTYHFTNNCQAPLPW